MWCLILFLVTLESRLWCLLPSHLLLSSLCHRVLGKLLMTATLHGLGDGRLAATADKDGICGYKGNRYCRKETPSSEQREIKGWESSRVGLWKFQRHPVVSGGGMGYYSQLKIRRSSSNDRMLRVGIFWLISLLKIAISRLVVPSSVPHIKIASSNGKEYRWLITHLKGLLQWVWYDPYTLQSL